MTGEEIPPKPLSESITELAIYFAEKWNISPFEVLGIDIDDFILTANTLILQNEKGSSQYKNENNKSAAKSDGFWDM